MKGNEFDETSSLSASSGASYLPLTNTESGERRRNRWQDEEGWIKSKKGQLAVVAGLCGLLVIFVVLFAVAQSQNESSRPSSDDEHFKGDPNIILFIADGYSPSSATFIRTMLNSSQLPLDEHLVGMVQTHSASSYITESSAAASAYSCGLKTYNEAISVLPDNTPCGGIMEAAQLSGRWHTGLVTTARITHATPAAFSAHVADRSQEEEIALQQATQQNFDLLLGGGYKYFIQRSDGRNLFTEMEARGYTTMTTVQQFYNLTQLPSSSSSTVLPLIGLFSNSDHLDYEIDRRRQNPVTQPSLSEMVQTALTLLSTSSSSPSSSTPQQQKQSKEAEGKEKKPFFLMIEAGRIDMAEHVNDPAGQYWESDQYMQSVELVRQFVASHPNTIVIATADHATGGFEMGAASPIPYQPLKPYEWVPDVVRQVTASAEFIAGLLKKNRLPIRDTMAQYTGITDMTDEEVALIQAPLDAGVSTSWVAIGVGQVVSSRAKIGWTTSGHTAEDVNLYHFGRPLPHLQGNLDNTDIANLLIQELDLAPQVHLVTQHLQQIYNPDTGTTTSSSSNKKVGATDFNYFQHD